MMQEALKIWPKFNDDWQDVSHIPLTVINLLDYKDILNTSQ
jgi:hypothetical protein